MTLAALQAGKHVYYEAPLANSIEDTKAIARRGAGFGQTGFSSRVAGVVASATVFSLPFIRAGVLGENIMVRAQSHQNNSWMTASSNPEHANSLNWRSNQNTSIGLMGEVGIHQIDAVSWFLKARP